MSGSTCVSPSVDWRRSASASSPGSTSPPSAVLTPRMRNSCSNRNHSRAANRVRASTGARTVIHADDADHARSQETELDDALEVGATIGPLEVVDASGRSPGEVSVEEANS